MASSPFRRSSTLTGFGIFSGSSARRCRSSAMVADGSYLTKRTSRRGDGDSCQHAARVFYRPAGVVSKKVAGAQDLKRGI